MQAFSSIFDKTERKKILIFDKTERNNTSKLIKPRGKRYCFLIKPRGKSDSHPYGRLSPIAQL